MAKNKTKRRLEEDPEFLAEYIKGSLVADIEEAMEQDEVNRTELAARLGSSKQYVSKVLNEEALNNFTLDSIAKMAAALQRDVVLRLKRYDEIVEIVPFADWKASRISFPSSWGPMDCGMRGPFKTQRVSSLVKDAGNDGWKIVTSVPPPDYGPYEDETASEVEENGSSSNATA